MGEASPYYVTSSDVIRGCQTSIDFLNILFTACCDTQRLSFGQYLETGVIGVHGVHVDIGMILDGLLRLTYFQF